MTANDYCSEVPGTFAVGMSDNFGAFMPKIFGETVVIGTFGVAFSTIKFALRLAGTSLVCLAPCL
jgi:hypothetical protein